MDPGKLLRRANREAAADAAAQAEFNEKRFVQRLHVYHSLLHYHAARRLANLILLTAVCL
jgi:hypothetical protein